MKYFSKNGIDSANDSGGSEINKRYCSAEAALQILDATTTLTGGHYVTGLL